MHILKVGCSIKPFLENIFISFLKKKSPTKYHPSKGVVMFNHIYKFQIHIQLNLWDVKLAKNKEKEKTVSLLHLISLLSLLCVFCAFFNFVYHWQNKVLSWNLALKFYIYTTTSSKYMRSTSIFFKLIINMYFDGVVSQFLQMDSFHKKCIP